MTASTETTVIPFNRLAASDANVRSTNKARSVEALAASIRAQGLLQNLVAVACEHQFDDMPSHEVIAGRRRFLALSLLVERGDLPADYPVPVKIVDAQDTTAASLTENTQREAMHPADEFDAFQKLTREGWTVDKIADAFGVTPLVVERRLKLAKAAPALIEAFRKDELTTDQLIALCSTEDHDRQTAVWARARNYEWQCSPDALRRSVLAEELDATDDPRVAFIGGLSAYEQAGGEVRKDLFSVDGAGGFITDVGLLDQLVAEKLEGIASDLRAEGWGWVEVWPEFDYTAFHRLGRAPQADGEPTPEAREKLDALRAEDEALDAEEAQINSSEDEYTEEQSERLDAIWERQQEIQTEADEIKAEFAGYAPEVRAKAGAVVAFQNGKARIERGMVKTADRKAVAAAVGDANAVSGGRETQSAGRKNDELSDALRRSLLGHRNLAAQTVVMAKPDVAKLLLACWAVNEVRDHQSKSYSRNATPSDLSISQQGRGTRTLHPITDEAGRAGIEAFDKACAAALADLPKSDGPLWDALAEKTGEELDRIIAVAVACSVSLAADNSGLTGKLIAAMDFDMAQHFTPTADNYLGRVSKPLVIDALKEAGKLNGKADETALLAMKKGQLAEEATKRLDGSGWVPKVIRAPKPKQPKAAKPAATKKAPASKAAKPAAKKAAPKKAKAEQQHAA